jgi:hypothetical protein
MFFFSIFLPLSRIAQHPPGSFRDVFRQETVFLQQFLGFARLGVPIPRMPAKAIGTG